MSSALIEKLVAAFSCGGGRCATMFGRRAPDVPWAEPTVPLRDAVVALVSTGGLHLESQQAFKIDDGGDAGCREIAVDASRKDILFTREYYDRTDAEDDLNLIFPLQRLQEMKDAGVLGGIHPTAYSLMGHLAETRLQELRDVTSPRIAQAIASAGVTYALLVPASGSCNRSVAILARAIEAAGVPTVSLSTAWEITKKMPPPRALHVAFPFGHALGEPHNRNQHFAVLHSAFRLLFDADRPGTVRASAFHWKRDQYAPTEWAAFRKLEPRR